ncbi:MAG: hypothetical protein ACNA7W_12290 [Pseudomonadales bacterium]
MCESAAAEAPEGAAPGSSVPVLVEVAVTQALSVATNRGSNSHWQRVPSWRAGDDKMKPFELQAPTV